jgi:hypothetical protein
LGEAPLPSISNSRRQSAAAAAVLQAKDKARKNLEKAHKVRRLQ